MHKRIVIFAFFYFLMAACQQQDSSTSIHTAAPAGDAKSAMNERKAIDQNDFGPITNLTSFRKLGRYTQGEDAETGFFWPGSGLELKHVGSQLSLEISSERTAFLNVTIDGLTSVIKVEKGKRDYPLYSGSPGEHQLRITRRSSASLAPIIVHRLTGDGSVSAPAAPTRRMLAIGDSITVGYGVDGADQHCEWLQEKDDHAKSYAAIAAQKLEADLHAVAISGRGLVRNFAAQPLPKMGQLMMTSAPGDLWDATQYSPDVILIHLGTNDFSMEPDPGADFVRAYVDTLKQLAKAHPEAQIYAAMGPMLDDDSRSRAANAIGQALDQFNAKADGEAKFIMFEWAQRKHVYGCNWHPGIGTHEFMAQRLVKQIRKDLSW